MNIIVPVKSSYYDSKIKWQIFDEYLHSEKTRLCNLTAHNDRELYKCSDLVCCYINELYKTDNNIEADITVLNTPQGKVVRKLLEHNIYFHLEPVIYSIPDDNNLLSEKIIAMNLVVGN